MKFRIFAVLFFSAFLALAVGACGDDGGDSDGENNSTNNGTNNGANNGDNNGSGFTNCTDSCTFLVTCIPDQLTQADCVASCEADPDQANSLACINAAGGDCTEALICIVD